MSVSLQSQTVASRTCVYCGKTMLSHLTRCPHCREDIPQVRLAASRTRSGGREQIRRALLYMLLAGVIQNFAGGHSGLAPPASFPPVVTTYFPPPVFLSRPGLWVYELHFPA